MNTTQNHPEVLSLMARMMIPFRRATGYSFDTAAFLEDPAYTQVIIQLAKDSNEPTLQKLGVQLATLLPPNLQQTSSLQNVPKTGLPLTGSVTPPPSDAEADQLRAELMRKYQGGAR